MASRRQLVSRVDYPSAWPALLQRFDPDGRLIANSAVQVEAAICKRLSGLPQLDGV